MDPADHVLIANEFANSITIYRTSANGDAPPVGRIVGTNTGRSASWNWHGQTFEKGAVVKGD